MLESRIERKFTVWCEKNNIVSWKFSSPGRSGVPDHIFHNKTRTAYIEFKQPGKKPTELQYAQMEVLADAGIPVMWTDNVEDAKDWLMKVFRMRKRK